MRINVGDLEVKESGTVLVPEGDALTLWPFGAGHSDSLSFSFPIDASVSEHSIEVENSEVGPKIVLRNWTNSIGTAITKPVQIGTLGGRSMYMLLAVHCIGSGENRVRLFSYTLLVGAR